MKITKKCLTLLIFLLLNGTICILATPEEEEAIDDCVRQFIIQRVEEQRQSGNLRNPPMEFALQGEENFQIKTITIYCQIGIQQARKIVVRYLQYGHFDKDTKKRLKALYSLLQYYYMKNTNTKLEETYPFKERDTSTTLSEIALRLLSKSYDSVINTYEFVRLIYQKVDYNSNVSENNIKKAFHELLSQVEQIVERGAMNNELIVYSMSNYQPTRFQRSDQRSLPNQHSQQFFDAIQLFYQKGINELQTEAAFQQPNKKKDKSGNCVCNAMRSMWKNKWSCCKWVLKAAKSVADLNRNP